MFLANTAPRYEILMWNVDRETVEEACAGDWTYCMTYGTLAGAVAASDRLYDPEYWDVAIREIATKRLVGSVTVALREGRIVGIEEAAPDVICD